MTYVEEQNIRKLTKSVLMFLRRIYDELFSESVSPPIAG